MYSDSELLEAHAELTQNISNEEDRLAELATKKSINVRLAEALMRKKGGTSAAAIRAIDLLKNWDANGDGHISRAEFLASMVNIEVEGSDAEFNTLFDRMDIDGSGSRALSKAST